MTPDERAAACRRINQQLDELSWQTAVPVRAFLSNAHATTEAEIAYAEEVIRRAQKQLGASGDAA